LADQNRPISRIIETGPLIFAFSNLLCQRYRQPGRPFHQFLLPSIQRLVDLTFQAGLKFLGQALKFAALSDLSDHGCIH
jgi:hypothetical protein